MTVINTVDITILTLIRRFSYVFGEPAFSVFTSASGLDKKSPKTLIYERWIQIVIRACIHKKARAMGHLLRLRLGLG